MITTHEARAIDPAVLKQLRERDDAGCAREPVTDPEGGALAALLSAAQRGR